MSKITAKYWDIEQTSREKLNMFSDESKRDEQSTVVCICGCNQFYVNAVEAPYTGGYIKLTCVGCNAERIIMDDYS